MIEIMIIVVVVVVMMIDSDLIWFLDDEAF